MIHNEDSRVKIPTILHLTRLGYTYLSVKNAQWDESTNVFTDIFNTSIHQINPQLNTDEVKRYYNQLSLILENEDLGKAFYEKLTAKSGIKLIDFENFHNNTFHVVTELPFKKDDEVFRPDITLLINGMPLAFIEVKKPNNLNGIQDEKNRLATRFQNKKFRKFFNITQLMVFSNNMEYDDGASVALQGSFYATTSYQKPVFNYFREEEEIDLNKVLSPEDFETENYVLQDNNLVALKNQADFLINKNPNQPCNKICTSLFKKDRLQFILQYALAYVKTNKGLQKHIMRYPQLFATKAIENKLNEGVKKGIIWHTQGSGKTALTYYNVKFLTDYFQKKGIIPKFYFIVDRIDLLIQSSKEFKARDLTVHEIDSRDAFARDIKSVNVIHNDSGKAEITVVNIQKFQDDADVVKNTDYNVNIQRIYFLDEVHRSYNPKGSFLANLNESDSKAIKIGLTGTPLLGKDYNSKSLFGNYIHKYYYNSSIADGYTLRLIREEIETGYKFELQKILDEIKLLKGQSKKEDVYAHPKFVEPMLKYIVEDFERSRTIDNSIGGMVVCDSAAQAKMMYEIFQVNYENQTTYNLAADEQAPYLAKKKLETKVTSAILILHDIGTKEERKKWVEDYKDGKYDFVFVYNMLLTGFDAPRLKKMYIGRIIKAHNLLQTLTRVNRTYKDFKYGYVVDFAGIEEQFKKTSQDYFNELQDELGDELQNYSNLFLTPTQIQEQISNIKNQLLHYNTQSPEIFSQQITQIHNRQQMLELTKALNNAKDLYNLIRLSGNYQLLQQLDFKTLNILSKDANNRLSLINTKEALENNVDTSNILNIALEDVLFTFTKIKEEEMILADKLRSTLQQTREMLGGNFDPQDPEFISLREELERLFKKKNLTELGADDVRDNIAQFNKIYQEARELSRKNDLLKAKYNQDEKYARLHKRLMEKDPLTDSEAKLFVALSALKKSVDEEVLQNSSMLDNESYVEKMMMKIVINKLHKEHNLGLNPDKVKKINTLLVKEYMNEYRGRVA